MVKSSNEDSSSAIASAIRAKRDRKGGLVDDIAALEASLIADIETFDLDAAERMARREQNANSGAGMIDAALVFPEIVPVGATHHPQTAPSAASTAESAEFAPGGGSLLAQLRQQAELRQREMHQTQTERTSTSLSIDQALKHLFFYFHDFVQQLNIVKPGIPRDYPLIEKLAVTNLNWQEGFSDYRTQSQSAGALVELVSMTYRLCGQALPPIERKEGAIDRFRTLLFDAGLPFNCKEFKNARQYVERAEFNIQSEISVSARWRADFEKGVIILETRNLERLGTAVFVVKPQSVDQALLDEFGRLVLGQPNQFRDLIKRR